MNLTLSQCFVLIHDPEAWGTRDFAVRDPSGNLLRIDQPPA